ncbi:MAG: SUMF1/EgtB/PvdO family nonheme iron enzyme [Chitinophagales bacterium]|nr:SUMF1/EgtB/PvdO family nonheme iron enzyme [Bacteroidota bacterium]
MIFRIILLVFFPVVSCAQQMIWIDGGSYTPLYGNARQQQVVKGFFIDESPVTNAAFLDFVLNEPTWQKSKVKRIFADKNYLRSWLTDTTFASSIAQMPVTDISWFAAKAYCECQGKRLLTIDEWEFVAMANETLQDARKDSLTNVKLLDQMQSHRTHLRPIKQNAPNIYGVYDLHGLVWEWTYDFNAIMISGENRNNNDQALFCGAGALSATDLMDYVAFMRYAFRASLNANFTIGSLGFRCAK